MIIKATLLAIFALVSSAAPQAAKDSDKLHYVFELTRHGARAPTSQSEGYTVEEGMLTPSGMRQRYLLGKQLRKRYMEQYELLDEQMGTEEVLMMSTLVNRTMQSGYSELMGLFPPSSQAAVKLT
mmetsp:Transcript_22038/g.27074  ORF Transcript_22038/g.27074 Transcript_22038/m.27074 type:complete len:125 (-) Transcript_22038:1125-1499(-)